jgi:NAD(P)-dependent dehydrogenase (short-subunit alcohol dehydrogenase family)
MKDLANKVAAVTGAASGIGRSLAVNLANEGCHVALSDINEDGLNETRDMIRNEGVKVTVHRLDVSSREQVTQYANDIIQQHGQVDIVINNAGTGLAGQLEEISIDEFQWLMGINFWGVVYGSMVFLPELKKRPEAYIVNVSSVHGLFTNPGVGPYCSSKFAVKGFTLTLCQELKDTPVRVACVHPGGIYTNIVRNSRIAAAADDAIDREEAQGEFDKSIARTTADQAAKIILRGIRKNKTRILVGRDAYVFDFFSRFAPVTWQKLMAWVFRPKEETQ